MQTTAARKRSAPAPAAPPPKAAAVGGDETRPKPTRRPAAAAAAPRPATAPPADVALTLYVRWHARCGRSRVHALPLRSVPSVDAIRGVSKSLLDRAFTPATRPDHLASPDFYCFTPAPECLPLPPDVARTEFRLTAAPGPATAGDAAGWEYGLLRRDLGPGHDPDRNLLVTVVEFESAALMAGAFGVRLAMVAYPVVCVRKAFLDNACARLTAEDPAGFVGVL